jgi:hypothetical protein
MKNKTNLKKVSDIVAEVLVEEKVSHVFAISGGASLHLIHSHATWSTCHLLCHLSNFPLALSKNNIISPIQEHPIKTALM